MVGAVTTALARSRKSYNTAYGIATHTKQAFGIDSIVGGGSGSSQFNQLGNSSGNRRRYALFRNWVHAAIHALAIEGASQPVNMGRLLPLDGGKAIELGGEKNAKFVRSKMCANAKEKTHAANFEIVGSHDLLSVLERPNKIQNRWQYVYSFIANMNLTGWGFIVRGTNEESGKTEFFSLPTTWVRPNHEKGAFSRFFIVNPRNPSAEIGPPLDASQVAFAFIPNPSDLMTALAPAQAQSAAINIDDKIQSSQTVFFENGVFPSMIVTVGKNPLPGISGRMGEGIAPRLTGAQRRQIYHAINSVIGGTTNYGRPAILDGLIERIDRWSATQNEMGWEKSEDKIRTRILSSFGVHPFILSGEMAGSYAQAYVIEDRFCGRVNTFLDLLGIVQTELVQNIEDSDDLLVWWDECKARDPKRDDDLHLKARANKDISKSEFRQYMGLPPAEDDAEEVLTSGAMLQAVMQMVLAATAGTATPEQAIAMFHGMGVPDELARRMAGNGPQTPIDSDAIEELQVAVASLGADPNQLIENIVTRARIEGRCG